MALARPPSLTAVHALPGYPEASGQKTLPALSEHRSALQQLLATVETAAAWLTEGGDDDADADADAGARTAETGSLKGEVDRVCGEVAETLAGVKWIWEVMEMLESKLQRWAKEVESAVEEALRGKAEVGGASKVLKRVVAEVEWLDKGDDNPLEELGRAIRETERLRAEALKVDTSAEMSVVERDRVQAEVARMRREFERVQVELTRKEVEVERVEKEFVKAGDEVRKRKLELETVRKELESMTEETERRTLELQGFLSERRRLESKARESVVEKEGLRVETERLSVEVGKVNTQAEGETVARD